MKKLILFISFIFCVGLVNSQTGIQINFEKLKKNVDKSNEEIQNPKKNIKEATWLSRATLMMEVYESQLLNTRLNMGVQEFLILAGQPKNRIQEDVEGVLVEKFVMERGTFYFVNQLLEKWEVTNPVLENPLDLALEAYHKAIELDVKAKKTKEITQGLAKVRGLYINEGSNCYVFKNFACSHLSFSKAIKIAQMPQVNQKDTALYYYAALSAQLSNQFQEAIALYNTAIDLNFTSDGNAFFYLDEAYKSMGDQETGIAILEKGFSKFPNNQNILFSMINYYLTRGEDPSKVLIYLDKAIGEEPSNPSLHFAKGTLHDKLGNFDEAVRAYQRATEIDVNYYDAYYNIGALYYNRGVKFLEEANLVPARDLAKYDALMAKANHEFRNSLPWMENAYKVKPTDRNVIESLKNIYFRFRSESDDNLQKYQEFNKKLQEL